MIRQLILAAGALLAAHAASAAEAGKIIFVAGAAQVVDHPAALGGAVNEGELLTTGADGYLYVKTVDNGLFILRPNTRARIATYHVDREQPANTRVKLELLSGVARSQSGEAVKQARQNFRFNTPVAAIGVRGTDFTVFTDQDTSRVTVLSGAITVSGFGGGCRPDGVGPCEGNTSRELTAAQKGQLLQVQRGQVAPQLMQGNGLLAPDLVAPPRSDEPAKGAAAGGNVLGGDSLVAVEVKKISDQVRNQSGGNSGNESQTVVPPLTPPIIEVQPAPPPVPVVYKDITWGRWTAVLKDPATSGVSKDGWDRMGMNSYFVLFREHKGNDFVTPEKGSVSFALADSSAYVRDINTEKKSAAQLQNGVLSFNFDKSSFATQFDLLTGGESFHMGNSGIVKRDGSFSVLNPSLPGANIGITGFMRDMNGATYLFDGSLDARRAVDGVTVWKK
ncbi:FecR domain-containing protein [Duganella sp. LX20W]|uniref:FecR domain-containing protein n=1 Tax=Rugamonas brunnea TaxID=2758569 RepID=A0A7W2EWQ9_9BURK|nr:FecR family protein [Rugamonas brunnea]MBA5640022.1 FecR domain-containing protein [Rugamonas brunnea]